MTNSRPEAVTAPLAATISQPNLTTSPRRAASPLERSENSPDATNSSYARVTRAPSSRRPRWPRAATPDYLGFAVPLRLHMDGGELRLLTTLTDFGTALDVTLAELRLEAFLPADDATAAALAEVARTARRR